MKPYRRTREIAAAAAALAIASADHSFAHVEILVGVNGAGQLKIHFHQEEPMRMPVSVLPEYPGWNASGPGIESATEDEPNEDFFALPDTAQIQVMLVAIDPTLHLFNSDGSGFASVGETYVVLTPFFHWHCFWNLSEGAYGTIYEAQLQFFDLSGQFGASDSISIEFVPQCPGDVDLSTNVDVLDLLAVINGWGPCEGDCKGTCHADLDATCTVDVLDLLTVINHWGQCRP